jgi:hypothetical protein
LHNIGKASTYCVQKRAFILRRQAPAFLKANFLQQQRPPPRGGNPDPVNQLPLVFAAVLILIYVLIVAWFRSFITPLIIMAPIPLTLVGILPGHWLFGAFFTATSMIGFIALAGIIVRNFILLVDFVEMEWRDKGDLINALIMAGAVGATVLTLIAVPLLYFEFFRKKPCPMAEQMGETSKAGTEEELRGGPKTLCRYFLYDRKLLADLSRCAWESLKVFLQDAVGNAGMYEYRLLS